MSCPICGNPTEKAVRPFCSARCAEIDLGKWMTGAYALPSNSADDAEQVLEEIEKEQMRADKLH